MDFARFVQPNESPAGAGFRDALLLPVDGHDGATALHRSLGIERDAFSPERVVLLPCSAGSARQWEDLMGRLAGFETIAIDLRGHGEQERWHGIGPLSLSQEAEAIAEACPDGRRIHLIGHSYGGGVALRFATLFPDRLRSLTLIEPSCFNVLRAAGGADGELFEEIVALADRVNRGVISGDYRAGMAAFIDYWAGSDSWEQLNEQRRARLASLAVHVAHHFCALMAETASLEEYATVTVPTLILCGARSPRPSRAIAPLLTAAMPLARDRTIRDAGHLSPMTHPVEVSGHILEHLLLHRGPRDAGPKSGVY